MAFPTIPTVAAGRVLTAVQADTVATRTFPSLSSLTKNSGDRLIAICIAYQSSAAAGAVFSGWGGGFTEIADLGGTTANMSIGVAEKVSTGSETGTFSVTQAATITGHAVMILMSIAGAHATTASEVSAIVNGTAAAADPAAFDPAGWAAEDTLWIAVGASGETSLTGSFTGVAAAPTNYTSLAQTGISADVIGGADGAVAFRQLNAASEDVGAFSVDVSNARNSAAVIAVRPAPAGGGGITSRTATLAETASGTSITGTLPADRVTGDLVLAVFSFSGSVAQFTGPGGSWTQLFAPFDSGGGNDVCAVYYQFDPAAGPTGSTSAAANRLTCICQAYGGVDTTTPLDVTPVTGAGATANGVGPSQSITTVTDNARLISSMAQGSSSVTLTPPSGMTLVKQNTSGTGRAGGLADQTTTTAGGSGAKQWTSSSVATFVVSFLGALRPAAGAGGLTASPADTLSLADALSFTLGKGVADTGALADAQAFDVGEAVADTATVADAATGSRGSFATPADTATVADGTVQETGKATSPADTLTLADAQAFGQGEGVADAATVTDAQAFEQGEGIADTATVADAQAFGQGEGLADALTLADSTLQESGKGASPADTLTVADAVTTARDLLQTVGDAATVADLVTTARDLQQALADTATLADSAAAVRVLAQSVSDALSLADALQTAQGSNLTVADAQTLADALTVALDYARTTADALTLADTVYFDRQQAIADAVSLADQQSRGVGIGVTEALVLVDSTATARGIAAQIADAIGLSETVVPYVPSLGGPYTHTELPQGATVLSNPASAGTIVLLVGEGSIVVYDATGLVTAALADGDQV